MPETEPISAVRRGWFPPKSAPEAGPPRRSPVCNRRASAAQSLATNARQFARLRIIRNPSQTALDPVFGRARRSVISIFQIIPRCELSPAKAAHMSNLPAQTAEPGGAVKRCPTVEAAASMETGEAVEATGVKSEAGKPTEGIAVAKLRPTAVSRPAHGIVAIVVVAQPDTAIARGKRVPAWADCNRSDSARRRSAYYRRGRERSCRARWIRRRYRNDLRVDRDGPNQRKD